MKNKLLILIPTYNEKENVKKILSQILALALPADILFIDDNSPDGTGQLLKEVVKRNNNVFVLHRAGKLGIGSAHVDGINWAYDQGYHRLITMDCDLSHSPEYIGDFLAKAETADIVVGSRYLHKKSLNTWNISRRVLTRLGHFASRIVLRIPYDTTGAFRFYRLDKISRYFLDCVHSQGYSFFFESLFILHLNGYKIVETSIQLPKRAIGNSKMRMGDVFNSIIQLFHIKLIFHLSRESFEIAKPFQSDLPNESLFDPQNWDSYWSTNKETKTHLVYDLIAFFYRKFIIRPALNHFILDNFNTGSRLLHAGCGSGKVDKQISKMYKISALDISPIALSICMKANKNYSKLILGSIFNMPVPDNSYDGIYNLGVMEHFSEEEIKQILKEFNRILKPSRKIVLFWPPEFGLSVMFLKLLHFILNHLFKKSISLHPPEISRVKSRSQVERLLNQAEFTLNRYAFGIRDLFTYVVIVGEKNS